MKIRVSCHVMPWEIDYLMLSLHKFKNSSKYIPDNIEVEFLIELNLSSYKINWDKSKISKDFFISKFNQLRTLIDWANIVSYRAVETDALYGHLDTQKISHKGDFDGLVLYCPDINTNELLFPYICKVAQEIDDKNYVLSPQIYKMWDSSWDSLTNELYMNNPHENWNNGDSFEITTSNVGDDIEIYSVPNYIKFAAWFDYFSKGFIDTFPIPDDWTGYGPWDYYSLILYQNIKQNKLPIEVNQYIMKGQTIYYYDNNTFQGGFSNYYKEQLHLNDIPNQRDVIEAKMPKALQEWMEKYKRGEII